MPDGQIPEDQYKPIFDSHPACKPGQIKCGNKCVDPVKDPNHCGKCNHRCGGGNVCMLGVCCAKHLANCGGQCRDLRTDPNNCGHCGVKCGDKQCKSGLCCKKDEQNCNGKCAELDEDPNNCGKCGHKCQPGQKCDSGKCEGGGGKAGCADGSDDQKFSKGGMVGCKGTVPWKDRAKLCAGTHKVCSADQWVQNRGWDKPHYNYWTNDDLRYFSSWGNCGASKSKGSKCSSSDGPMRVCASKKDALGNTCNWTGCGYNTTWPNQYFGGCKGNKTAGAICCPK